VIDEELWFGAHDHAVAEDTAARSMAALVGRIIGAKPFPITARRLADLTRQDVVRIEPVIQVLESDPGLSARLLRLVNSAGYALRQRCTSVRHAATLVGTDRLHQIATTAAVLDLFDSKGPAAAQIIEHSTIVGAFCRYLGAHLALPVDDLFTAGFLHDIGKLMLMETENEQYIEMLSKCSSSPDTIHHLERALYGFDHAVLAAHVLTAWNIPDPVPKIVAWHHEPAQAYRVSSMMAALVQTVRLSDALVYAMQAEPDRGNIKELAQLEAASYLDISEPQLAAMWDELRVLFDESREQCLGENAPALDPRSLRPKRPMNSVADPMPSERTVELPKQFPCVECACPTFGNTCPACGGHVCSDHQVGRDAWCALCARDYRSEKSSMPVPMPAKWAFGALSAAVGFSGIVGMISAGGSGALRAGFGTLLLGSLVTLLYVVGKQWFIRSRFVQSRPNRFIAEPRLNDGGTQSLVPPDDPHGQVSDLPLSLGVLSRPDVYLVEPLNEIQIREIPGQNVGDPECTDYSADALRIQLQSRSLVTLPAPAKPEASQDFQYSSDSALVSDPSPTTEPSPSTARDDDSQPSRATLHGPEPEFEQLIDTTSSTGFVSEELSGDPGLTDAPETSNLAVVRPMPTIDVGSNAAAKQVVQQSVEDISPPSKDKQSLGSNISVHPLAALGFLSESPPELSQPKHTPARDSLPECASVVQTNSGATDHNISVPSARATNDPMDLDFVASLIDKSASRFGDEFEARVRELVAQRVAEIVAERMLAALGSGPVELPRPAKKKSRRTSRRIKAESKDAHDVKQR
jgi:putative nucleotidyltransferase with HDIG domain